MIEALESRRLFNALPGDANDDGRVDTSDFAIFAQHFSGTGACDFNQDGEVNGLDFNILACHFGDTNMPQIKSVIYDRPSNQVTLSFDTVVTDQQAQTFEVDDGGFAHNTCAYVSGLGTKSIVIAVDGVDSNYISWLCDQNTFSFGDGSVHLSAPFSGSMPYHATSGFDASLPAGLRLISN